MQQLKLHAYRITKLLFLYTYLYASHDTPF